MSAQVHVGEYDTEPVRGLPELLPPGEEILWQGAPSWRRLARSAFHTRKVAVYFSLLLAWRLASSLLEGEGLLAAARLAGPLALLGLAAVALLAGMAWLNSRTTVYTITNERVVIRFGVALTLAVNLPFRSIRSAELRPYRDGSGDIPLAALGVDRLGFLMLWPHVRPWRFGRDVEPMLRAVPDAERVAATLARALAASAGPVPAPRQSVTADARRARALATAAR
jgi:hypothetical protein